MAIAKIESALPGQLFHKPDPDSLPYKKEGDAVAIGDTLALVEVMKSFLPLEAEIEGTFIGYVVFDGEEIEPGTVICEIEAG